MDKIVIAKTAGFCFGVSRSVKMAENLLQEHEHCFSYGELIHNADVVSRLEDKGLAVAHDIESIPNGSAVLIRSHGISKQDFDLLNTCDRIVVDATCPKVKKIHHIVSDASERNRFVIIIGVKGHPEVSAIEGWCNAHIVIQNPQELQNAIEQKALDLKKPITVVSQTTQTHDNFIQCTNILKKLCTNCGFLHRNSESLKNKIWLSITLKIRKIIIEKRKLRLFITL